MAADKLSSLYDLMMNLENYGMARACMCCNICHSGYIGDCICTRENFYKTANVDDILRKMQNKLAEIKVQYQRILGLGYTRTDPCPALQKKIDDWCNMYIQ